MEPAGSLAFAKLVNSLKVGRPRLVLSQVLNLVSVLTSIGTLVRELAAKRKYLLCAYILVKIIHYSPSSPFIHVKKRRNHVHKQVSTRQLQTGLL